MPELYYYYGWFLTFLFRSKSEDKFTWADGSRGAFAMAGGESRAAEGSDLGTAEARGPDPEWQFADLLACRAAATTFLQVPSAAASAGCSRQLGRGEQGRIVLE